MKNDGTTNWGKEEGAGTTGDNSGNGGVSENTRIRLAARNARSEGLQKGALTTGLISLVILIAAAFTAYYLYKGAKERQIAVMENQQKMFSEQLTSRDSVIGEWIATFDEIEKNLSMVKEKENIITIKSNDGELSKNRKDQILKDIEYINALLDQNKQKIASLNAQLRKSGGTIKVLEEKIAELEETMKTKEAEIAELKTTLTQKDFEINELNTRVSDQELAIAQKEQTINNQTEEMHKAFYTTGTYKELKTKGLVTKEGGFIGMGRKEQLIGTFSENTFQKIDITQVKSIPLNTKSAKLITDHPATSYEMIRDKDNKIASLEIKNPDEFWKISKYAVVEVK